MILKQKFCSPIVSHSTSILQQFKLLQQFGTESRNIRVPLVHPTSHKLTDQYIFKYQNKMFSAYLKKRKIPKTQVYPKMHIIDDVPENQQYHLSYQNLYPLKKTLDDSTMQRIIKEDPTKINSAYIMSMFLDDDGYKQMMDEYLGKVLVCGKAPGGVSSSGQIVGDESIQRMEEIQDEVLDLYNVFYFGQELSNLQKEIQFHYLATKQEKSIKKQMYPKNAYYRCIWRPQDQRLLEDLTNWAEVDMNLNDINNRPFYEPYDLRQKLPYVKKFSQLMGGDSILSKLSFQYKIKPNYIYSYNYLNSIVDRTFSRLVVYIKCIEFTNQLRIPPDFSIEISMLNIHIWLIIDRLKKFNTKQSKNLIKFLQKGQKQYIDGTLSTLNIKKLASAQKSFNDHADLIFRTLDMHFNNYQQTSNNPYISIDALVWSVAFRQKVQRYGDQVYRMSEYLIKNYNLMQRYSQQDIINCIVQFDVFFCDPDYKQTITSINPPMDPQQFQQQFNSNKQDKAYYYKTNQMNQSINIQKMYKKVNQKDIKYSLLGAMFQKTLHFLKKYTTNSKSYDHFSEIDEQIQQRKRKAKRSPWKNQQDKLEEMQNQFDDLQKIRRKKRKANFNKNTTKTTTKNQDQS